MIEKYLACPDSPITVVDHDESRPGALVSRKLPQCPKEKIDWPSTVINTRGSSGVTRTGACVGTPEHFLSDCLASLTPGAYTLEGNLFSSKVLCRQDRELGRLRCLRAIPLEMPLLFHNNSKPIPFHLGSSGHFSWGCFRADLTAWGFSVLPGSLFPSIFLFLPFENRH